LRHIEVICLFSPIALGLFMIGFTIGTLQRGDEKNMKHQQCLAQVEDLRTWIDCCP